MTKIIMEIGHFINSSDSHKNDKNGELIYTILIQEQIAEYDTKPFYCKQKKCAQKEKNLKRKKQQEK